MGLGVTMPPHHGHGLARGHHFGLVGQPLPSVEPALLLADLLDESEANSLPAFDSVAFDGLPIAITSFLGRR